MLGTSENNSRLYKNNPSTASLPATPTTLRPFLPRARPSNENVPTKARFSSSPDNSFESSGPGSPLYMRSSTYPPQPSAKGSPRTRDRRSRQSLSLINNQSSHSLDDSDVAQKASGSLAQEKMAWKVINKEISEWQDVCHTGRPSWWSPTSRWTRRVQSQSSISRDTSRDTSTFGTSEWVDEGEDRYYPDLCFEYERRKDTSKNGQPWLQEMAFLIAVQLLSACFTLPVELFSTFRDGLHITYDMYGVPEMPDERLISSLRMHTNYRWSPAFGHEARNTSPETQRSASYGGHTPYTQYVTTPGGGVQSSPDVGDSGCYSKRKKQQHRARHVTPAETEHQESWEDTFEKPYDSQSPMRTPTLGSWRDTSWRDRRNMARSASASYIPVPGRVVRSAPGTPLPLRTYRAAPPVRHYTEARRDEYPFPVTNANEAASRSGRSSLHPHLRTEPHPVFVQPVRELVANRWRTFRRRFGYSLSHGNADRGIISTDATFTEEYTASTLSSASPSTHPPPRSVRRRREARTRHDIHSSSVDSSPHYNTPTSGTHSGMTSGMTSPGFNCAAPQSTPMTGEVDDLIATARAITNSSSAIPQDPLTANQPFPVFTPNNTPDFTDEDSPPPRITRSDADYFTASRDSSTAASSSLMPKVKNSSKRRSGTHGSRRSQRSRLSEVYTQEEVAVEESKYHTTTAVKRRFFDAEVHSTLTTPTEESESNGSGNSLRRRGTVIVMGDPPPASMLSPNQSAIVRLDSPTNHSPDGVPRSETAMSPSMILSPTLSARPPSVSSVDTDPFAFLSPRRDAPETPDRRGSPALSLSDNQRPARPHRPSLGAMSKNGSALTQMMDSPSMRSRVESLSSRPSMSRPGSYTFDRWAAATPSSLPIVSRDDTPSPSYMETYRNSPPGLTGADALRQSVPAYPRHLLPSSLSRGDSRASTPSSPNLSRLSPLPPSLKSYPQRPLPSMVRGDSGSSATSDRPDLVRAATSFPHPGRSRPHLHRAAISWTNTPNNSEDGRRGSWQSHKAESSNDDAYDPHAVDCHSNVPSRAGSKAGSSAPGPGGMRSTKTEPIARKEGREARKEGVMKAEAKRSASVGASARPGTIRRSVSTPIVRPQPEYQEQLRIGLGRNRLSRVSSSGTTHFSSGPESAEVQGIPVGPNKEAWDVVPELWDKKLGEGLKRMGSRRKKARSFL